VQLTAIKLKFKRTTDS